MKEKNIVKPGKIPEWGQRNPDGSHAELISYDDLPKPVNEIEGMRCAFKWYDTYSKAKIASFVAKNNYDILGCDSWRQRPGDISEDNGLFRVTFP